MDFIQIQQIVNLYHQKKELQPAEAPLSQQRPPDHEAQWNQMWRNSSHQDGQDWLLASLLTAFRNEYWWARASHLIYYQVTVLVPLLTYYIFQNLNSHTYKSTANIMLVIAVGLVKLVRPFLRATAEGRLRKIGQNMQEILSRALLKKTMKVCIAQGKVESSELVRMMQVEMDKMAAYPLTSSYVSSNTYCIVFNMAVIVWLFGWAGLAGIGTLVVTLLLRVFIKIKVGPYEEDVETARNERVRQCVEVLGVMKLVKVRALEGQWWGRLMGLREAELAALHRKNKFEMIGILALAWSVRLVILVVCLLLINQQDFGPAAIFTLNYIFINLNFHSIIMSLATIKDTQMALKNIQKFLQTREINTSYITRNLQPTSEQIIVQKGNFYWNLSKDDKDGDQHKTQDRVWLSDVDLQVKCGELVAVIGRFGSGKTSLLQAILGEMQSRGDSRVILNGRVGYVAQKPWILSGTVRDNILFGAKFDQERYSAALHYACMLPDLQILDNGDQTVIGERGCTLSGGQKARVALARAIYSDSDILLLDDILSAVDAHVGAFLFNETLRGYLHGKAIILITHALHFAKQADRVVVIQEGRIISNGTFQELQEHSLVPSFETSKRNLRKELHQRQNQDVKMELDQLGPGMESKEDVLSLFFQQSGGLRFQVLSWLFVGITSAAVLILGVEINQWANAPDKNESRYVSLYLLLVGFISLATLLLFYYVFHSPIHMNVYRKMITGMLFAPLSYFDITPASKVVCRLSSDLAMLDKIVLVQYFSFTSHLAYAGCFALSIAYAYWQTKHYWLFVIFVAFFGLLLFGYGRYLQAVKAHRQAEEQLKIPINTYFAETVEGQATIRAFGRVAENECGFTILQKKQGKMRETVSNIEILINLVISLATTLYLILLLVYFFTTEQFTTFDVFLLANIFSLEEYTQRVNQNIMELLVKLKCLTKCHQLATISPESGYIQLATTKDQDDGAFQRKVTAAREVSPFESGQIVFQNVCAAYRPQLGDALRDLSFTVRAGEKIGIVGRTGSGKSTLLLALLRIIELRTGTIKIGGINCAEMGLSALRSNISVILQDHFLFAGTVRDNVDPSHSHSAQAIQQALRQCKLWEGLERRQGLNTVLLEGGENFSVGERQLLNIARAMLQKRKIVLVDEATASVDSQTDAEIQDVLRRHFSECTVLTIAHRLDSVAHCDRILVLQNGESKEFDSPKLLLRRKDSVYRQLCEQTRGKI